MRRHTIKNNFIAPNKGKKDFEIIPANGTKQISATNQSVVIYEFGTASLHTDEYLLYYLPEQKSIVIGDLWNVPEKGVYGSTRARNINDLIQKEGIDVDYIYQTWPLQHVKKVADIEELKRSAELSHKK